MLTRFAALLAPGGVAYVSTPNRLTLAPAGAERSDNPWHVREYTPEEYLDLVAPAFGSVELLGLFHARKLRAHELALRLGWDRAHAGLRITRPFYDRFVPAISERDFELRARLARALAGPAGGVPAVTVDRDRGELCILLHSHMPYVEGFGTWPFGEEWLLEAMASSYLPLLGVLERHAGQGARGIATVGVTPVLADQLALPGVGERFLAFMRGTRRECHSEDGAGLERAEQDAGRRGPAPLRRRLRAGGAGLRAPRGRHPGSAAGAAGRWRDRSVGVVRHARGAAPAGDGQRRADAGRGRSGGSHPSASGRGAAASGCRSAPTGRASRTTSPGPACRPSASTRRESPIRSTTSSRSPRAGRSPSRSTGARFRWCGTTAATPRTRCTGTTTRRRSTGCGPGRTAAGPTTATSPTAGRASMPRTSWSRSCFAQTHTGPRGRGPPSSFARSTPSCSATGGTRARCGSTR